MWRGGGGGGGGRGYRGGGSKGGGPKGAGFRGGYRGGFRGGGGRAPAAPTSWKRKSADDKDALPALRHRKELLDALREHAIVVVSGDTGCGKSTQVPQFLLEDDRTNKIVVTQPRRLAARALAERVASERGSTLGRTVGYAVSRDKVTTLGTTRVTFMTVGLLLQLLIFRPQEVEEAFTHIVVDEAHERDVDLDLLLLLLKRRMKLQASEMAVGVASDPRVPTGASPSAATAGASTGATDLAPAGALGNTASPEMGIEQEEELLEADGEDGGSPVDSATKRQRVDSLAGSSGDVSVSTSAPPVPESSRPRPKLSLVVMSATIDANAFAGYYAGCSVAQPAGASRESRAAVPVPVVKIGSRAYEVTTFALEAVYEALPEAPKVEVDDGSGKAAAAAQPAGALPVKNDRATRLHPSTFPMVDYLLARHAERLLLPSLPGVPAAVPQAGGVLIFLPGFSEIHECHKVLKRGVLAGAAGQCLHIVQLHALLDDEAQSRALARPPPGCIKVILATNIAESALTVPDVSIVIDLGLEKLPYFDARANTDTLLLRRCARASAIQRAGRAGRVAPGVCLRLFPAAYMKDLSVMPAYTPAEMERTSLLNLVLKVKMMEPAVPPAQLLNEAIQPPTCSRVAAAVTALSALGALSTLPATGAPPPAAAHNAGLDARVTPLGRLVAALPVSVPIGRLLVLGEALGCGREGALLAAMLTLPDPFLQPYTRADGAAAAAADAPADGTAEAEAAAEDATFFKPRLALFTSRGCSDPLASLALFEEWQRRLSAGGPPAAAQYAQSQKASYKRLSEIEYLSRELTARLRRERADHGLALPPSGAAADGGPNLLTLQALLCAAFLPNVAIGRVSCPADVLHEISRHRLTPKSAVTFIVAPSSSPGAHLTQAHIAAALKPCGKLEQALISKSRVVVNGVASLQTSVVCTFGSAEAVLLAVRMAGMRGSLPVPITSPDGQVMGTAYLQKPQYACRLRFHRLASIDIDAMGQAPPVADDLDAANEVPPAATAQPVGEEAEMLPVDMLWHSGSAVLSASDTAESARFLLATAWSRAGYRKKLLAHGATLLPSKPTGAAQLLILLLSRSVRLIGPPGTADAAAAGGAPRAALAVQVADGKHSISLALPWLLQPCDLDNVNELRTALSLCTGDNPAAEGESAAALQLRLMKLLIEKRPPLSDGLARLAAAAVELTPPFVCHDWSPILFPPIAPPIAAPPAAVNAAGAEPMQAELGWDEGGPLCGVGVGSLAAPAALLGTDGDDNAWTRNDEDEELELLEL